MLVFDNFIIEGLGLVFAGVVQGVTGFGIGLVAVGVLTIYHPPAVVIPALSPVYIITNVILFYEHRKYLSKKMLGSNLLISFPSIILALLGMIGGSFLLKAISSKQITFVLGIFIILFSLFHLYRKTLNSHTFLAFDPSGRNRKYGKMLCYVASSSSGIMEGFLGLGGPPIVMYLIYLGLDSKLFITSFISFFLGLNPLRFADYLILGLIDWEILKFAFFILIFVLIGLMAGMVIRRWFIDEGKFKILAVTLLIIIGISLIFKSFQ